MYVRRRKNMALRTQAKKPEPISIDAAIPAIKQLTQTATKLNSASDRFNDVVQKLDGALKSLHLGIAAWFKFNETSDDDMNWETFQVGYDKLDGKWGLAVRKSWGNENWPEDATSNTWLFADAPRDLRIKAVHHIPALLQELNAAALRFTDELVEKTTQADELAEALEALNPKAPSRGAK
jgi:hypothetical protein